MSKYLLLIRVGFEIKHNRQQLKKEDLKVNELKGFNHSNHVKVVLQWGVKDRWTYIRSQGGYLCSSNLFIELANYKFA